MTNYLRPGVFVEETLRPLTDPSADSADSLAAFVGTSAKGGPLGPILVTSWSMFQGLFGSIQGTTDEMAYSVYSFFNNGGSAAYIVRTVNGNATAAAVTVNDVNASQALTVTAKSPGTWASAATSTSRIFVSVAAGQTSGRFDFIVEVGSGTGLLAREQFVDLTLNPTDARYALTVINSPTVGSKYVSVTDPGTWSATAPTGGHANPAVVTQTPLTGGSDGTGTPDLYAAYQRLEDIPLNLTVNLPGCADTTVLTNVINLAATNGKRFIVVDCPKPSPGDTSTTVATAAATMLASLPQSSYAAMYTPWMYAVDPSSGVNGALRLFAPGGMVLGQYSRNDVINGVQRVPAGVNTALRVIDAYCRFTDSQLDTLNSTNINVLRSMPGVGHCIMGARTLATRTPDKFINIRRTLMYLRIGLTNVTRYSIFEPNDDLTWETLSQVCSQYLQSQWQVGLLRGQNVTQAYYVKCDSDINTAQTIDAGIVNIEIGVALAAPAEFIVIRIGQFDGGATVTETPV